MRSWQFWWNTLIMSSQYNPAWFVECLMLMLTSALFVVWMLQGDWPYLMLSSSYSLGAAMFIWVREAIAPSHQRRLMQAIALLSLVYSLYSFADVVPYIH